MTPRTDAEEFTDMVNRRWHALVRAAMLLGCSVAEAEDVTQTALTRCYQHWGRVRRADDQDAYVHRVLVNTFIDSTRRRLRAELPIAVPVDEIAEARDHDRRIDIERALGALSTDQRVVVVLRYYLDLSEKQAAAVLGVPRGTVKSRLARGLGALAEGLRPGAEDLGGIR